MITCIKMECFIPEFTLIIMFLHVKIACYQIPLEKKKVRQPMLSERLHCKTCQEKHNAWIYPHKFTMIMRAGSFMDDLKGNIMILK